MAQGQTRYCEVLIIGAGMSGLCAGMRLRQAGRHDFLILESASRPGGTWRDNTYPGAACDIPAMFYSFSFELKTDWSRKYPPQEEILAYLEHCAGKYDLYEKIRFNTPVAEARYDESRALWRVCTGDGEMLEARVLVTGTGQLNRPFIPEIEGRDSFSGHSFHSACWDHEHGLRDRNVAVIGNAASAIQFIPQIAREARRVTVIQRSANWMLRRGDRAYTRFERRLFQRLPWLVRLQRARMWLTHEVRWPVFARGDNWLGRLIERSALRRLRRAVHDPAVQRKLTPDYPMGCKRILISDDYWQAVNRNNVNIVTAALRRIHPEGLETADGDFWPADTLIYATGFRTTEFLAPVKIYGREGLSLDEAWRKGAEAYLGITLPGFPNLFMCYGPNTNLGHNSIIFMIEQQVDYILQCLKAMRERELVALELRETVMDGWRRECEQGLAQTVWSTGCHSWYKNSAGRITNNWPYSTLTYWRRTRRLDLTDYHQLVAPHESPAQTTRAA